MKIRRQLRSNLKTPTAITVTGPDYSRTVHQGVPAAQALALDHAARLKKPGTFEVREYGDVIYRAIGDGKGAAVLQRVA